MNEWKLFMFRLLEVESNEWAKATLKATLRERYEGKGVAL